MNTHERFEYETIGLPSVGYAHIVRHSSSDATFYDYAHYFPLAVGAVVFFDHARWVVTEVDALGPLGPNKTSTRARARARVRRQDAPPPTCEKCNGALKRTDSIVRYSNPMQVEMRCETCGATTFQRYP